MQVYLAQRQAICPTSFHFIRHQSADKHKLRRLTGTLECNGINGWKLDYIPNLSRWKSQFSRDETQNSPSKNVSTESVRSTGDDDDKVHCKKPEIKVLRGDDNSCPLTRLFNRHNAMHLETVTIPTMSNTGENSLSESRNHSYGVQLHTAAPSISLEKTTKNIKFIIYLD